MITPVTYHQQWSDFATPIRLTQLTMNNYRVNHRSRSCGKGIYVYTACCVQSIRHCTEIHTKNLCLISLKAYPYLTYIPLDTPLPF